MTTDPAGNFSLLPSYFAEPGTTIRTEQHNPVLEDIAQGISQRLMRDGRNGMVGALDMGTFPIRNLSPGVNPTDGAAVSQLVPIGVVVDFAGTIAPAGWMFCYGQAISRTTYASLFAAIGTTYGAGDGSTTFNLPDARGRVTAGKDDMGGTDATRLSAFFGAVARTLGGVLGAASHILTVGQLPSHNHGGNTGGSGSHNHYGTTDAAGHHTHGINDPGHYHNWGNSVQGYGLTPGNFGAFAQGGSGLLITTLSWTNITINGDGTHAHNFGTNYAPNHAHGIAAQGADEAHTNAQPTLIMNKIIKVSF